MLVATDLDGTLVPNDRTSVSPYTADVLKRVDDASIPVVSNGAITYDVHNRQVITVTGIGPALGLNITGAITAAVPGSTFAIECLDGIRQDPDFIAPYRVPHGAPRGPLAEIWDVPAPPCAEEGVGVAQVLDALLAHVDGAT